MRRDSGVVFAECIAVMTGPTVVARSVHHAGAHGIEFDVAVAGEQVGAAVDQCGFEASFPERAGALVSSVECADVSAADGLHQARCVAG